MARNMASTLPLQPSEITIEPTQIADHVRRQANVRLVSVGSVVIILLVMPATLFPRLDTVGLLAFMLLLVFAAAAIVLNARGAVHLAALVLLTGLLLAILGAITASAYLRHGLDLSETRLLDLFALPIVLSTMTRPRRAPLVVATITSIFTIVALSVFPRTPMLTSYYLERYPDAAGSVWDVYAFALGLQWGAALLSYGAAISVQASLHYAARADALYEAHEQIAAQAEEIARRDQQLTDGMQRIQETYSSVVRGQWTARVQAPDNEMLPLALIFNRLLDRNTRLLQTQAEHSHLLAALHAATATVRNHRENYTTYLTRFTGTALDELVEVLHESSTPRSGSPRPSTPSSSAPLAEGTSARHGSFSSYVTLIPLPADEQMREPRPLAEHSVH